VHRDAGPRGTQKGAPRSTRLEEDFKKPTTLKRAEEPAGGREFASNIGPTWGDGGRRNAKGVSVI